MEYVVMNDRRGTELKEGQTVAYNLSGEVALGEIVSIKEGKKSERWKNAWEVKPLIKVRNLDGASVKISKVRKPKNLLVISSTLDFQGTLLAFLLWLQKEKKVIFAKVEPLFGTLEAWRGSIEASEEYGRLLKESV